MSVNDVLLHIPSYPEPMPPHAIDQAVGFVRVVGGKLTALAVQIRIDVPVNPVANYLIGLNNVAREEENKSLRACQTALEDFSTKAREGGVFGGALLGESALYAAGEYVARHARTRDLCLVPVASALDGQRAIAEAVVFGSARPVLLFRPGAADLLNQGLSTVVMAWDGSRSAARAMADALPIMQAARQVRVLTVINEKPEARQGLGAEAVRHLEAHGITAVVDEVDAGGRRIGKILEEHVAACGSDLLVMGAYGRSRVREFILGGATEHMLDDPKTPLLLSH